MYDYDDDDDRRSNFLTYFMVFCFIAVCVVVACAPERGDSNNQIACYEEVWRAEDIQPGHSCRQNQRLVIAQSGAASFVKCVCD